MTIRKSLTIFMVVISATLLSDFATGEASPKPLTRDANSKDYSIKDYGELPQARSLALSPDGKHYAFIRHHNGEESFVVVDIDNNTVVGGARLGDSKARGLHFIDKDHIVFTASETTKVRGYRGKFEGSGSIVMNLKTQKMKLLLNGTQSLYPAQSGLGAIVGFDAEKKVVFMPAYSNGSSPAKDLYRVNLKRGDGRVYKSGNSHTIDWFMGENGRILAREDYDEQRQEHRIYSYKSGKRSLVYSKKTSIPDIEIRAVAADEASLLFIGGRGVSKLSLDDGSISEAGFADRVDGALVEYLKTDLNRKLISVGYSGLLPFEVMANQVFDDTFSVLRDSVSATNVSLADVSRDYKKMIIQASGNQSSGTYVLYDSETNKTKLLAREYNNILEQHIGEIVPMQYSARDGRKIPSILTWPTGVAKGSKKKLPLIVLPHGGPASYDYIKFDWWSQYLARKGYLVLQPNFRGSSGFGFKHQNAGDKEWGKAMQDDVSDGVKVLVDAGYADAERVCIMGASYGGYSALAGGAFTPELYRCVISVAGVSDLLRMLKDDRTRMGRSHWGNRYWQEVVGNSKSEKKQLHSASPVKFASQFQAPVLLIHGKDDTVVPFRQSRFMHKALRKAGKETELLQLEGEDHWLSKSETRLAMLKAIDAFLDAHNPVRQ